MKIAPFKIKVNKTRSEKVQEILFGNGYKWNGGSTRVDTRGIHLYFYGGAGITDDPSKYPVLTHTIYNGDIKERKEYFKNKNIPELTYEQFIKLYDK